eukprot:CAMPEP_0114997840 /NCGR_PEP_ID=MMETSP0216-20121206/15137_1 /TAXON_ID=223996 /ORGANISM="Protocruzia adherens, Strain Boccale" /LENGTH=52 /DNA_ID=CAMNT_0002362295 /DNA_START=123 /DNA_END=281 /DNA_ORIENTATION=-
MARSNTPTSSGSATSSPSPKFPAYGKPVPKMSQRLDGIASLYGVAVRRSENH